MGGIVIDIWEKSNFFGPFGSQKGAKNADLLGHATLGYVNWGVVYPEGNHKITLPQL